MLREWISIFWWRIKGDGGGYWGGGAGELKRCIQSAGDWLLLPLEESIEIQRRLAEMARK